jgi:tetratricopeptide (TPR) repeat protein
MPERARVHYNLGLLLQHLGKDADAEKSLRRAQELDPDNFDYLYALADFYLKRSQLPQAGRIAQEMVARHPDQQVGHDILNLVETKPGALSD